MKLQLLQQPPCALRAACRQHIVERIQPFACFKHFQAVIVIVMIFGEGVDDCCGSVNTGVCANSDFSTL